MLRIDTGGERRLQTRLENRLKTVRNGENNPPFSTRFEQKVKVIPVPFLPGP